MNDHPPTTRVCSPASIAVPRSALKTAALTCAAMVAFAANSILTRAALGPRLIDPASFTLARLGSGALALALIAGRDRPLVPRAGSWTSAAALFAYAASFSFAYLQISAGLGALVLFGCVQVTMIGWGIARGERPSALQWCGIALALAGLVWLVRPTLSGAASAGAVAAMMLGGSAWGVYSLRGRSASRPLATTAANFVRSVPFALALQAAFFARASVTAHGVVLAVLSGALASGAGYAIWYAALPGLRASQAAVVQLSVPPLAAGAGVLLLGERLDLRWLLCAGAILGGIALTLLSGTRRRA